MTIAPKLRQYLDTLDIDYTLVQHPPSVSTMQSATMCRIPPGQVAKAVLLDTPDDYLLAVLPSDRRVDLDEFSHEPGGKPRLADEQDLADVFYDCAVGAVPPLGTGYGIATIIDDSLWDQPDVYFEGGDHRSLIHVDRGAFAQLTRSALHGRFSERWADME